MARSLRSALRRAAISAGVFIALGIGLELGFRTTVPGCEVTPFQSSSAPGLVVELRPSFETFYKGVPVGTNAQGFRGPELRERDAETMRVVLAGDSYTYGSGVAEAGTLRASLERALGANGQAAEVISLGVPGYTALEVASAAERHVPDLDPDVLVYVFFANDVDPMRKPMVIPPDAHIDSLYGFVGGSAFLEWCKVRVGRGLTRLGHPLTRRTQEWSRHEYENGGGERVRETLRRLIAVAEASGARLMTVTYPFLTPPEVNPFCPIDELCIADAQSLGIETLSLLDAFEEDRDLLGDWANIFDSHPSPECHQAVADYLAVKLLE